MVRKQYFYAFKPIRKVKISKVIYTDASVEGWEASYMAILPQVEHGSLMKKDYI